MIAILLFATMMPHSHADSLHSDPSWMSCWACYHNQGDWEECSKDELDHCYDVPANEEQANEADWCSN